jgi:CDP-diacylglycerol--glycerol-3-phosphate 3-phosphatidyltransferase
MTKADKITLSRIILAPVFFLVYFYSVFSPVVSIVLLWILFIMIELSDYLDGKAARKYDEVSPFGKLFDPFADVIARVTYFVCFVASGIMPFWIFLVIIYREFGILFLRMLLSFKGIAMGARPGGKLKAVLYMTAGIVSLLYISIRDLQIFTSFQSGTQVAVTIIYILAVLVSVISFIDYFIQFKKSYSR